MFDKQIEHELTHLDFKSLNKIGKAYTYLNNNSNNWSMFKKIQPKK